MTHVYGENEPHGFQVCARLARISAPFDAGQRVELQYHLAGCHGLMAGGMLIVPIPADQAPRYMIGDEISIRVRPL